MTSKQITKDNAYDALDPTDFPAMMNVDRYNDRSTAFDKIISATHDHFWDPLDKKHIDFSEPFDIENEAILPDEFFPIFQTKLGEKLSGRDRVKFANESARWILSSILHGEQGALSLSASLCHILKDPGAQEYASNQAREEAREARVVVHVAVGINMDRAADTGNDEEHHQAERVELEAEIDIQAADGQPVDGKLASLPAAELDHRQREDEACDNRADGQRGADGFVAQGEKRDEARREQRQEQNQPD